MIKTIIFDFDGTIADTVDAAIEILNELSTKYDYKKITDEEYKEMRDHTVREMFEKKNVPFYKLPFMMYDVKKELSHHIDTLKPIKEMRNVLYELKKKGYKLAIITSNNENNVQLFLKNNDLNIFDYIYTGTTLFGKAKVIQGFVKKYNLHRKDVIYIGDEMRDIEATKKVGIPIITVTWGVNSKKGLERAKPEFMINNPQEILTIVDKL